jgi:LEA14-like dessication related protein
MHRTHRMPARLALRAALLTLCAAGCALTQHFEAPQLSIAGVQIVSTDVWQQRLKVRMHVHNPNNIALPVKGIEYSVELAGQQFASGESDAAFTVPALGDAEFDTTLTTNVTGALLRIFARGGNMSDPVDYHLTGKVTLQGFMRSVPFDQKGSIKLQ